MKCPNCGDNFALDVEHDVIVQEAAHDEQNLDITIVCPLCGHRHNTFVDIVTLTRIVSSIDLDEV